MSFEVYEHHDKIVVIAKQVINAFELGATFHTNLVTFARDNKAPDFIIKALCNYNINISAIETWTIKRVIIDLVSGRFFYAQLDYQNAALDEKPEKYKIFETAAEKTIKRLENLFDVLFFQYSPDPLKDAELDQIKQHWKELLLEKSRELLGLKFL